MFYQPLAEYWERFEDGQASPAQLQAAEAVVDRLTQLGLAVSLAEPVALPEFPEAPLALLPTVGQLLASDNPRWASVLFRELVDFHRVYQLELDSFARLYPGCAQVVEAARQDLIGYQQAVGAMVQEDWAEAASMWATVSSGLQARLEAMAELRAQHGCDAQWFLDELAWSCQRGRPDASALLSRLDQLESDSQLILDNHFPDPRLIEEWSDLWRPRLQSLRAQLNQPELGALPPAREWLAGQRHWMERAGQRRDFSRLAWWGDLRPALLSWFGGRLPRRQVLAALEPAENWLGMDLSLWPELDRQLRQHHLDLARALLERIRSCLLNSDRARLGELVASADASYDRWLWLSLVKA